MMADYRERAFITMVRTLYPEVLKDTQKSRRYRDVFTNNPAYLSSTPRCELKTKLKSSVELKSNELEMLDRFLLDNNYQCRSVDVLSNCNFHARVVVNNIMVSTVVSEAKKVTCDSIVCACYEDEYDDDHEYFFGQVQHIVAFEHNVILCVDWFQVPDLDEDQFMGLVSISAEVTSASKKQQKWMHVRNIVVQQHILVEELASGKMRIAIRP